MRDLDVPVVDLAELDEREGEVAEEVFCACVGIGFFYVKNHGLPQYVIDRAFAVSESFFNLPDGDKRRYPYRKDNTGYTPLFQERLDPVTQKAGDTKESFNFVPSSTLQKTELPEDLERGGFRDFEKVCHGLAMKILQLFALALRIPTTESGKSYFVKKHRTYEADSATTLRILHYPPREIRGIDGSIRAGSHTDYGTLTLLFQRDIGGLELQAFRSAEDGQEAWIKAPPIPGLVLVNVGDLLELWTRRLFRSTRHRVVHDPSQRAHSRYSIAYFVHPDDDEVISEAVPSPLVAGRDAYQGEPITAANYLRARLDATYLYV